MGLRYGVDLGGTKIELVALNANNETVLKRRTPTPTGDYTTTVQEIINLIQLADSTLAGESDGAIPSIGIGIPGTLSKATGLVKNANSTCLIGKPLQQDLEAGLGRPVRIANDADCFALSEASDGAGAGFDIVFGVILGTGVGGGLVIDQKIVRGPNAITGEWGHNPLPWPDAELAESPGPPCYCGKFGCIETFLSGPGLIRDANGQNASCDFDNAEDLASAARDGDENAITALERYTTRLAKALASVINVLDPDIIVLGGGLSNVQRLYDDVPRHWDRFVFSDTVATRLVPPQHGDSSGVRGAAWLWPVSN